MRILLFTILCLSTAACIAAEINFVKGQRQEGDHVIANRTIFKPAIPWRMVATIGISTRLHNEVINRVEISSVLGKEIKYVVIKGGIGKQYLIVKAIGKFGEGLYLQLEGFAIRVSNTSKDESSNTSDDKSSNSSDDKSSNGSDDKSSSTSDDENSKSSNDSSNSASDDKNSSASGDKNSSSSRNTNSSKQTKKNRTKERRKK